VAFAFKSEASGRAPAHKRSQAGRERENRSPSLVATLLATTSRLTGDPTDLGQVLRRQRRSGGAHILLDLLRRGGAGDNAGDHAIAQQPTERQLEDGVIPACGECLEFADDAPIALVDELLRVAWVLR